MTTRPVTVTPPPKVEPSKPFDAAGLQAPLDTQLPTSPTTGYSPPLAEQLLEPFRAPVARKLLDHWGVNGQKPLFQIEGQQPFILRNTGTLNEHFGIDGTRCSNMSWKERTLFDLGHDLDLIRDAYQSGQRHNALLAEFANPLSKFNMSDIIDTITEENKTAPFGKMPNMGALSLIISTLTLTIFPLTLPLHNPGIASFVILSTNMWLYFQYSENLKLLKGISLTFLAIALQSLALCGLEYLIHFTDMPLFMTLPLAFAIPPATFFGLRHALEKISQKESKQEFLKTEQEFYETQKRLLTPETLHRYFTAAFGEPDEKNHYQSGGIDRRQAQNALIDYFETLQTLPETLASTKKQLEEFRDDLAKQLQDHKKDNEEASDKSTHKQFGVLKQAIESQLAQVKVALKETNDLIHLAEGLNYHVPRVKMQEYGNAVGDRFELELPAASHPVFSDGLGLIARAKSLELFLNSLEPKPLEPQEAKPEQPQQSLWKRALLFFMNKSLGF